MLKDYGRIVFCFVLLFMTGVVIFMMNANGKEQLYFDGIGQKCSDENSEVLKYVKVVCEQSPDPIECFFLEALVICEGD